MPFQFPMLFTFPNLITWLSQISDWPMKLELPNPSMKATKNRKRYFEKNGINIDDVVSAEIVHGTKIAVVTSENKGQIIAWVDWLITNETDLVLSVTIADCVPIYFYDDIKKVIWITHAWWRWITNDITKSMVDNFVNEYNSNPEDIFVYVGPHIQKCHFEIKEDIVDKFDSVFVIRENETIKVDLLWIIRDKLEKLGLKSENISSSLECTYCESSKYFSFRRDKPEKVEAMIGVIGMK